MKEYDVIALGELLIDFTQNGISEQGNDIFEANPGGAPCNVLAMLSKLGYRTAFIGKVGDDFFGKELKHALEEVGIQTSGLGVDDKVCTTLAFVHTVEDGDRDFTFYRNPGADMMLKKADINVTLLEQTKIFHFGTLSMTHDNIREATKYGVEIAKKNGSLISFDPNIREPLWGNLEEAREQVNYGLSMCDVLKISDNEIEWLTGSRDYTAGVKKIREKNNIPLILVTMGREGSRAYYEDIIVEIPAFFQKNTVDTTGAGDTFAACVLHFILKIGITNLQEKDLVDMLRFANAAASIITTRKGALRVMPSVSEITQHFQQ